MTVCILCKVVDNFGDAGFAWRLASSLLQKRSSLDLRFVCDSLKTLSALDSKIKPNKIKQRVKKITIYDWHADDFCEREFGNENAIIIVQCFQCPYPFWLEKILFDAKTISSALIVNVDYLTAENYAAEFHLLPSLTRRRAVQKINFMPGFSEKTAGLLFRNGGVTLHSNKKKQTILFFCYERDCAPIMQALSNAQKHYEKKMRVLLAWGAMQKKMLAFQIKRDFTMEALPFLRQKKWDALLGKCSILFVRGEDSLASACLLGLPFIWQAYAQDENYQLVKVRALLETMRKHFLQKDFLILERAWILYNDAKADGEALACALFDFLTNAEKMRASFFSFSNELKSHGDFAEHLLSFLESVQM